MINKNRGSSFDAYLLEELKSDDQAVFFHIREALDTTCKKCFNLSIYLLISFGL